MMIITTTIIIIIIIIIMITTIITATNDETPFHIYIFVVVVVDGNVRFKAPDVGNHSMRSVNNSKKCPPPQRNLTKKYHIN